MNKAETITIVEINSIVPNERNRNDHPEDQIDAIIKIIEHSGFRSPLVVSNQSGLLVCGHGRLEAAKRLGMTHVPVMFQDFASPDIEYQHGVADNALAARAKLDLAGINQDLPEIGPFDLDLLGIKNFKVEAPEFVPEVEEKEPEETKVICPSCSHEFIP
ncbi:MAG: ParB N-terminal domain-containing protein [Alphaproteobacteria bacterium]|nr:ParB N-terminal domain-containing protein [Alphaproteobacteria bacterium]